MNKKQYVIKVVNQIGYCIETKKQVIKTVQKQTNKKIRQFKRITWKRLQVGDKNGITRDKNFTFYDVV